MTMWRPTYAEIDLGAIRANVRTLAAGLGPATRKLAVVKANAYGHGDVEIARACLDAGATWLAVALVEEGVRLREAGIDAPILLLVEATPEAAKEIVAQKLTPSVFTRAGADALSEAAAAAGTKAPVHVCIDTGMHREGADLKDATDLVADVAKLPGLELEGMWSHLAVADEEENRFTERQRERFAEVCEAVERSGIDVPIRHLGNSVAAMAIPQAHYDLVRLGIAMYGLYPAPWLRSRAILVPAMRLVSSIGTVHRISAGDGVSYGLEFTGERDTTIATVLIGYADGYPRRLSNRAEVLVDGRRHRLAGRVTMDQIMIDCRDENVAPGDEAVLIGRQKSDEITADELAAIVGTINYEIVSAVGVRVPRIYVG